MAADAGEKETTGYYRRVAEMHQRGISENRSGSYGDDGLWRWDGLAHPADEAHYSGRTVSCRKCGQPIEGDGFGSPETGWEHPFTCPHLGRSNPSTDD